MSEIFLKKMNKALARRCALLLAVLLAMSGVTACGNDDPVRELLTNNTTVEVSGDDLTTDGGQTTKASDVVKESTTVKDETSSSTTVPPTTTTEPPTTTTAPPTTTVPPTTTAPPTTKPTTTQPPTTKPVATTTQPTTTSAPQVNYNVNIQKPVASGNSVSDMNGYVIDYSNMKDGYVMIKASTSATAVVQIYLNSKEGTMIGQYIIDATDTYLAFPLTKGANTYCVRVLEQTSTGKYAQKNTITEYASISPETKAYIYPNMYVEFNANSTAVRLSCELVAGKTSDEAKVNAIYNYIVNNIDYDYDFAKKVSANGMVGYMDAERCLKNKKGICGDYSVLFATMCRAQGIPCMVVEGYVTTTSKVYHAWNKVYVNGSWKFYDTTFDAGGGKGSNYVEVYFY